MSWGNLTAEGMRCRVRWLATLLSVQRLSCRMRGTEGTAMPRRLQPAFRRGIGRCALWYVARTEQPKGVAVSQRPYTQNRFLTVGRPGQLMYAPPPSKRSPGNSMWKVKVPSWPGLVSWLVLVPWVLQLKAHAAPPEINLGFHGLSVWSS